MGSGCFQDLAGRLEGVIDAGTNALPTVRATGWAVIERLSNGSPVRQIPPGMWAAAHGLALLIIDGRLAVLGADRADALIASTLDAVLRGYAAPVASGGFD